MTHQATQNKNENSSVLVILAALIITSVSVYTSTSLAGPDSHRRIPEPIDFDKTKGRYAPSQAQVDADAAARRAAQDERAEIAARKAHFDRSKEMTEWDAAIRRTSVAMKNREQLMVARDMIGDLKMAVPLMNEQELKGAFEHSGISIEGLTVTEARNKMLLSLLDSEKALRTGIDKMPDMSPALKIEEHPMLKGAATYFEKNPQRAGKVLPHRFFEGALALTGDSKTISVRAAKLLKKMPTRKFVGGVLGLIAAGGVLASESQDAKSKVEQADTAPAIQNATTSDFAARGTGQ